MPLELPVAPMKAVLGSLPVSDDEWAFEIKWDGYRTLAMVERGRVRLQSSRLHDVTATYPELAELHTGVHAGVAILDGELVALDDDGRPRFELVQGHKREVALYVFDVLRIDAHDTIGLAYEDRRRLLGELVEAGPNWYVPSHRVGDGAALMAATRQQGLEGVMAKRLGSTYLPGKRSSSWRKVKHRQRIDVVIGGFSAGEGNRERTFGSLLVGLRDPTGVLRFAGGVGTGFDQRTLERLTKRLRALATRECPFDPPPPSAYRRGATWVRPELGAEIEMTELTNERYVRHGAFIRLIDEPPGDA